MYFWSPVWRNRGAVAALACHLHARVVGTDQVRLQMEIMVQSDGAGIGLSCTKSRKIRVFLLKVSDGSDVVRSTVTRAQVSVTLGAGRVRRGLEEHRTLVLDVAGGAFGRECLIGVMLGRVVTGQAGLASYARAEDTNLG